MHFVSSGILVLAIGFTERKFRKWSLTIASMGIGVLCVVGVMTVLNLTVTVWFLGAPRQFVIDQLHLITLFNIIKPSINCAASALVYLGVKPYVKRYLT